jgi:prepilin-type processing-associated H-X9-DG protein
VELLVVIAIIGVLVSLLLPAVQSAREAARRIQCSNNVKQLALGSLHYEEAHGTLPRSGIVERTFREYGGSRYEVYDQSSGKMFSWVVQILPYIEQQALYDQFDMDRSVLDQQNEPQSIIFDSVTCPSDGSTAGHFSDATLTQGKRFAKGNYAAYVSPMHGDLQLLYPAAFISSGLQLKRVADGASNTLALSEVRTVDFEGDERGAWALPWNGATQLSLDMHAYTTSEKETMLDSYTTYRLYAYQSQVPNFQGGQGDILVNCPDDKLAELQLEGMPCTRHKWPLGLAGYISAAPRSQHVGGVNAGYLDGHVEFITNDINPVFLSYLVGIQDGDIPNEQETDLSAL